MEELPVAEAEKSERGEGIGWRIEKSVFGPRKKVSGGGGGGGGGGGFSGGSGSGGCGGGGGGYSGSGGGGDGVGSSSLIHLQECRGS